MAYQAGNKILDDEYNNFVTSSSTPVGINHMIGTGSGVYGLGQTELGTVDAGTIINASQWNSLFSAMDNIANHLNVSITSTEAKSAGDSIAIKSNLINDLQLIEDALAGGSTGVTALTTSATLRTSTSTTRCVGSHVAEHSVTFSSADQMRHFFNGGGKIRTTLSRSSNGGGSATSKDSSFDELISAIGNFDIGSKATTRSGSGETVTTDGLGNGFHDLGTGYTVLLKLTQDSGTYTSNYIQIEAKLNAAPGTAVTMTIKTSLVDADAGDGTFTSGNTSGVDTYANFVGTTNVNLATVSPNTSEGLVSVPSAPTHAEVSNTSS